MLGLAILLTTLAGLASLIYIVILIWVGIKAQQVSIGLRLGGSVSICAACLFGALGYWFASPTDPFALLLLIPLALLMGLFLSWSLLPYKTWFKK